MDEQDTPRSGSRWEPTPAAGGDAATGPAGAPGPSHPAPSDQTVPLAAPGEATSGSYAAAYAEPTWQPAAGETPRRAVPGRGALAGAAAGLVLVSGLGGFALGHVTAGNSDRVGLVGNQFPGQPGQQGGFGGPPPGFDRDGDGRGVDPDGDGFDPRGDDGPSSQDDSSSDGSTT